MPDQAVGRREHGLLSGVAIQFLIEILLSDIDFKFQILKFSQKILTSTPDFGPRSRLPTSASCLLLYGFRGSRGRSF